MKRALWTPPPIPVPVPVPVLMPVLVLMLAARPVRADDAPAVRARAELLDDKPRLKLDPVVAPRLQGLGATEDVHESLLQIGPNTTLLLEGTSWIIDDAAALPHLDLAARGWRAGVRLSHDFGFLRVTAYASVNHIDTRYGSGYYRDLGLAVTRTVRLSRWMTGWISLSVGRRTWQGEGPPPAGESDGTEAMLTIGTTFR